VVNRDATSTSLVSSANPSVYGQQVTFTATVAASPPGSGTPTGPVTFLDGSTPLGTGNLSNGVATLSTSSLAAGAHAITAVYGGDANFLTSTSNTVNQTVGVLSFVVTNTSDSGLGSLRQAILNANANPGLDTITFQIPGSGLHTIIPLSPLPAVTDSVVIDGYSQPGSRANSLSVGDNAVLNIEIDGESAGSGANGLTLHGGGSTVQGLMVDRFQYAAVYVDSASPSLIQGNFLGTNGTAALPNDFGVLIGGGATGNTVGGTAAGARNVVSGNNVGVVLIGAGTSGNVVEGDYIGTNAAGTAALGNTSFGVYLLAGASSNTIGGTAAGARNVISGNAIYGVLMQDSVTSGNVVAGNYIGTNPAGTTALGNSAHGVYIGGASGNVVGGTAAGARNVISGNRYSGVILYGVGTTHNVVAGDYLGTNAAGNAALPNGETGVEIGGGAAGNTVGGTAAGARNVISGNAAHGVWIHDTGTSNNVVAGNYIGTSWLGTAAIANNIGVMIGGGASGNTIGGTAIAAKNVVSGNATHGVQISDAGTSRNVVAGNFIGTTLAGNAALGNGSYGVYIAGGASRNTGGGTAAGARNVVSGNASGVVISGGGTSQNLVAGNFIGTTVAGNAPLPNAAVGVWIAGGASGNTIGGAVLAAKNTISGNGTYGVEISGSSLNVVAGDYIGTDVLGGAAVGNGTGVRIDGGAGGNTIGGELTGARNVISGNLASGVEIASGSWDNWIAGDWIGRNAAGTAGLGNGGAGVLIGGSGNTVGGSVPGAGNTIAYNGGDGVAVPSGAGNVVRRNLIYANLGKGIDLALSGNDIQPAPVLTSAAYSSTTLKTTVAGTLTAQADTTYIIELFASTLPDPSGLGQGQRFLTTVQVTTDDNGLASFSVVLATLPVGQSLTATATSLIGDTSEFSSALTVS
jgi:hypothetical protein